MSDSHATRVQGLVDALKAQREELTQLIAEYEMWNNQDAEERAAPQPNNLSIMNHQSMRSLARERIVGVTSAMAASARTLY